MRPNALLALAGLALIALAPPPVSSAARAEQHPSPGIDRLVQDLAAGEPAAREAALVALTESGREAVPALIEMLKADDRNVRKAAAEALAAIGAPARAAVPALIEVMQDEDRELRDGARRAVVAIRTEQIEGQQDITLRDGRLSVRIVDRPLEPVLEEISRKARVAIIRGEGVGGERVSAEFAELPLGEGLREILKNHDAFLYYRAGGGLRAVWVYPQGEGGRLEPVPPEAWASTKELEAELAAADPEARARAFETLIERKRDKARELVDEALRDESDTVRSYALQAAISEGVELSAETLHALTLGDPAVDVRFLALQALSLANDPDLKAIARSALEDASPHMRSKARQILRRLEPPKRPAAPAQPTQAGR